MAECSSLVVENLISQALLGTALTGVDFKFVPNTMCQEVEAILSKSADQEEVFLRVSAMLIAQNQTSTALERNSLSLEQMSLYQQAIEQNFSLSSKSQKPSKANTVQEQGIGPAPAIEPKPMQHMTKIEIGQKSQLESAQKIELKMAQEVGAAQAIEQDIEQEIAIKHEKDASCHGEASAQCKTGLQSSTVTSHNTASLVCSITDDSAACNSTPCTACDSSQSNVHSNIPSNVHGNALNASCPQKSPLDQTTAKKILAEVKKHQGPMPLPQVPYDERPLFPQEIEYILKGFVLDGDEYQVLLYQTLQQFASCCNMRFSVGCFPKLAALFQATFLQLDQHFSSVMIQELLIRCGGPNFLYVLPFYLPNVKSIFFKSAKNSYRPEPIYRVEEGAKHMSMFLRENGSWTLQALHERQVLPDKQELQEILHKANKQDALGLLIKLRYDNPPLALKLLSANISKFRPSTRVELIKALKINLSVADEVWLLEQTKSDNTECSVVAKELLEELHGSQYAQSCAQIVREHLIYSPKLAQWTVKPIDLRYSKNALKLSALGITLPSYHINPATNNANTSNKVDTANTANALAATKEYLQYLLCGMDWEDLRDLTGATEFKDVFVAWNRLKIFNSQELNLPVLLASKIYLARDKRAAYAFVQDYPRKFYWNDKAGRVLMLLDIQDRISALKLWRSCDPCPDWFVELDSPMPLYEPHYVDEAWLEAVVQICLERFDEDEVMDRQGRSRILEVMSPSCMSWLLVKLEGVKAELAKVQEQHDLVREQINSLSPCDKGYNKLITASQNLSVQRRMWQYRVNLLEYLRYMLKLSVEIKTKIAQMLESSI